jgi:hypothetical protein
MPSPPRPLIPRPGNAVRPVFFLLAFFFGLMLIGFPILMYAVGLGTASTVWITLLILAVAVGMLWFTVRLGQNLQQDEESIEAGEVWTEWTVPPREHRAFVANERRSTNRRALLYGVGGVAMGLGWWRLADDRLTASIMVVMFLLAALIIFFFAGPPRGGNDDARRVRIGPLGVHSLGRYLPFHTTMIRIHDIEIDDGVLPFMRFTVRAGHRLDEIRVPIPRDQLHLAKEVAQRLRRQHDLDQAISQPDRPSVERLSEELPR